MIYLVISKLNNVKSLKVRKILNFYVSNNYCNSIFDLIAKKKLELENKNDNLVEQKLLQIEKKEEKYGYNHLENGVNRDSKINNRQQINYLKNKYKMNIGDSDTIEKSDLHTNVSDNYIYNNKLYILKYIKHLQINDELSKYRFITKYVINNITKFYDNEVLFILKIFSKKKYKNLLFLQCTSEYFYWLCKLNKHSKKNISYYLYFCSVLNYIPTMKYLEEYTKIFNFYEKGIKNNFFFFNMIEEESNLYHKNVKYIIHVLYFLNKANIKNDLFDILLYMCSYYASDLTLKGTFLLLKIIVNLDNDKYNLNTLKNIHKNIERHLELLEQHDFNNYLNILLFNNINLDDAFFIFVKNYMEKNHFNLSVNSVMSILKIKKKVNYRDPVILKKLLDIITHNFYDYNYGDILNILKILAFFNYFNENFFYFLFSKFVNLKNCPTAINNKEKVKKNDQINMQNKMISNLTNSKNSISNSQVDNIHAYLNLKNDISDFSRKEVEKVDPNYLGEDFLNETLQENSIFKYKNKIIHKSIFKKFYYNDNKNDKYDYNIYDSSYYNSEDINNMNNNYNKSIFNIYEDDTFKNVNDYNNYKNKKDTKNFKNLQYQKESSNKKINELTHLPLHLNVHKTKMKINYSNIMENQIDIKYNKLNEISYDLEYIEMFINLFIYLGKCGFRSIDSLNILSHKIQFYLCMRNSYDIYNKRKEVYKDSETKFIGFYDNINNIKKNINFNLDFQKNTLLDDKNNLCLINYEEKLNEAVSKSKQMNDITTSKNYDMNDNNSKNKINNINSIKNICNDNINNEKNIKKLCLRFIYDESEKINLTNLKKKKELIHDKDKLKKNISNSKYANVESFRISRIGNINKMNNLNVEEEKPKKKKKKNSVIIKFFNNFHPALIRLHNRKLFRKYFYNVYRSEKYTEKVFKKRKIIKNDDTLNSIDVQEKKDMRLKKYKKIRNLRNVCLKRYKHIFENETDAVSNYLNKLYQNDTKKEENNMLDMIANNSEIHVDDSLFVNYNLSISNKKFLKRYNKFITNSNQITHEEYIKKNNKQKIEGYKKNDIIKWIYRFRNNYNIFNNEKNMKIIDNDIKMLNKHMNEYCGVTSEKLKISFKHIALIAYSCRNLYYFDKNLIDILFFNVFKIIDTFYISQKKGYNKNNHLNISKKDNYHLFIFENIWKYLTICLQMNHFARNILKIDNRYKTIEKLIKLYTHSYFIFNFKNMIYIFNYLNRILWLKNSKLSFVENFLISYFDISIILESFFIYNKNLFLIMDNNYKNLMIADLKNFHYFIYYISKLYLIYLNILINKKQLPSSDLTNCIKEDDFYKYLTCINFYIIFSHLFHIKMNEKLIEDKKLHGTSINSNSIKNKVFKINFFYNNIIEKCEVSNNNTEENNDTQCIWNNKVINKENINFYNILTTFFKYIKFLRNHKFLTDSEDSINYLYHIIRFYYIFKKIFRNKNINYINEKNYQEVFPLFVIQILNKKQIKEINIDELFFFDTRKYKSKFFFYQNTLIYNYFLFYFLKKKI
ncbi:conserved Plasmodium protein, unknown function [Plasmodium gallinaceum]|uniref:Uncharacterized protein n=1 Tax=Plasmodium gallinaceum TaxID=5849 RepID=A0A1J1GVL9_PLAGA|nr:conserved Plasmodium protein, unknown function [Plasmodium gallinaceum]CRG96364.1 conserved Plasmodium protein, unknown function [Plasmodium gallinaceum]